MYQVETAAAAAGGGGIIFAWLGKPQVADGGRRPAANGRTGRRSRDHARTNQGAEISPSYARQLVVQIRSWEGGVFVSWLNTESVFVITYQLLVG